MSIPIKTAWHVGRRDRDIEAVQSTCEVKKSKSNVKIRLDQILTCLKGKSSTVERPNNRSWLSLCFWFIAISTCLSLCVVQISNRIRLYMTEPVITSVQLQDNLKVAFPKLTFCGEVGGFTQDMINMLRTAARVLRNQTGYCPEDDINYLILFAFEHVNVTYVWQMTNISKEFEFTSLSFKTITGNEARLRKDYPLTYYGTCLTLWTPDEVKSIGNYGHLYVSSPEKGFPFPPCGSKHICGSKIPCLSILAHSDDWSPLHWPMLTSSIQVAFGTYGTFLIYMREFSFLNTTSNPCVDEVTHYRCLYDCMQNKLRRSLKCRLPFVESPKLMECKFFRDVLGAMNSAKNLFNNPLQDRCGCLRSCQKTQYFLNPIIYALNQKGFRLKFRFADSVTEIISENLAYDLVALLSDIGGSVGLYLGVCLLSILQFTEMLIKKSITYCLLKENNKHFSF